MERDHGTNESQNIDSVIVGQPEFYTQAEKSLKTVSLQDWKTIWDGTLSTVLRGSWVQYSKRKPLIFTGTVNVRRKTQRPRWKRVLDKEEGYLGDALLGQLYVFKYVPQV